MQLAVTRADTVFEHHDVIAKIAGGSSRAFDTTFRGDAADQDRTHAIAAQDEIQIRADKAIRAAFLEDNVLRLRLQLFDNFAIMRVVLFLQQLVWIGCLGALHPDSYPYRSFFFY